MPQSESDRREAAATWLVRLQADQATGADWQAFEAWLGDPANKAALAAVEAALGDVEDYASEIAEALDRPVQPTRPTPRKAARGSAWKWAGAAAAIAVAAALAFAVLPQSAMPPASSTDFVASADATRLVTLTDGSTVRLNRGAAISARWSAGERRVVLTRGEAAFTVRHDAARPFVVAVGDAEIRDIGTEFNVLRRSGGMTVTVRDGAIEVIAAGLAPTPVSAGNQLDFDAAARRATLSAPNADDAFAWQDGRLVYHGATLAKIVGDLNRYGKTPIRIADPATAALRFSGVLKIQTLSEMTSQLEAFLPLRSESTQDEIVLRSR